MRYELPPAVKAHLATPAMRLHHLLWHAIRDSWHDFSQGERDTLAARHPEWVPNHPRFVTVPATPENPAGIAINWGAGESFLYMHRRMIHGVNRRLEALGEPALIAWPRIPAPDDPDYPVPDRNAAGPENDPKSDAHLATMMDRAGQVRDGAFLRSLSLAALGAFIETAIHDSMHMRWTDAPGVMNEFPPFDPENPDIEIPSRFHHPSIEYLGHPYSSHVNSTFWKLHGWVDETIEHWRVANGLEEIEWRDTWTGDAPESAPRPVMEIAAFAMTGGRHDDAAHEHHAVEHLTAILQTINGFENCHASFSYALERGIPIPDLRSDAGTELVR